MGQGTTFKIYLPSVEGNAEIIKADTRAFDLSAGDETVLLVEDEEVVREMAKEILQECGYHVLQAKDGQHALELAGQHDGEIHLMLTDVVMPRMSGRELSEQLTPLRPEIRVLYMSGYTDDAIVHHGVLDEGTAFIGKPFSMQALARKVRETLDAPLAVS